MKTPTRSVSNPTLTPRRRRRLFWVSAIVIISSLLTIYARQHPDTDLFNPEALLRRVPDYYGEYVLHQDDPTDQQSFGVDVPPVPAVKQCAYCNPDSELCQKWGAPKLSRALGFQGTNARLHRFLRKVRSGEPFTLAAIGGSVSSGHGCGCYPLATCENNMHRRIFDHLDKLFPAQNGTSIGVDGRAEGKNTFINGAVPATGSNYFSLCFKEHIPEDVDIVITELAINDQNNFANVDNMELMIRGLMDLPSQPAIINAQIFALMFAQLYNAGDLWAGLLQYLDVPSLSLRNLLLPDILENNDLARDYFGWKRGVQPDFSDTDLRHMGGNGHALMADLVNAYIDMQLCEMDAGREVTEEAKLPQMRLWQPWAKNASTPVIQPQCSSTNSKFGQKLTPKSWGGWHAWSWKEEKHYIISNTPGQIVTFDTHISAMGKIILSYQRSAKYGLGNVQCWVGDDKARAVTIQGYWERPENIAQTTFIRNDLAPGDYELHCELLKETADPGGGTEFRIIAVMAL